jgi:hypothetical protein
MPLAAFLRDLTQGADQQFTSPEKFLKKVVTTYCSLS